MFYALFFLFTGLHAPYNLGIWFIDASEFLQNSALNNNFKTVLKPQMHYVSKATVFIYTYI